MPVNATPVAMDVEKLYRCQQFFIQQLLPARGCNFSVLDYQTSREKFERFYQAVRSYPSFESYFHITGTIPVRKAVRRQFKALMTSDVIVPNKPKEMPEGSRVPSVPLGSWPLAVKKEIAKNEGEQADETMDAQEREQEDALATLAMIKRLPKKRRDELFLNLDAEQEDAVQQVFRAISRRRKLITVSPEGVEAADILADLLDEEDEEESREVVKKRPGKKKGPPAPPLPELEEEQEKLPHGRERFLVHFLPSASDISFGKPAALPLIAHMKQHGYNWLFLVTVSGVTPYAVKELEVSCAYEVWPMRTCLSRINSHYTVPNHRRLLPSEKAAFYAQWHISPAQVPRMLATDPVAKFLSLVPGDVVEISRKTFTGNSKAFRVVTHAAT